MNKDRNDLQVKKQVSEINKTHNFDHPDSIDWPLLNECLDTLLKGEKYTAPLYDSHLKMRTGEEVLEAN